MPTEPNLSLYQPQDHETIAVGNVVVGLTVAKAALANLVEVVCEVDSIRYWKDTSGNPPTNTQGILVGQGERFYLYVVEITAFRAVRTSGNATLQVTYYIKRIGTRQVEHA